MVVQQMLSLRHGIKRFYGTNGAPWQPPKSTAVPLPGHVMNAIVAQFAAVCATAEDAKGVPFLPPAECP